MMNLHFLVQCFLVISLLQSCNGTTNNKAEEKQQFTYDIFYHEKKNGAQPRTGDKVRFYLTIYKNGLKVSGDDLTGEIPPLESISAKPDLELLYRLSVGDSASIYVSGDKIMRLGIEGITSKDTLQYSARLVEIKQSAETIKYYRTSEETALAHLNAVRLAHLNKLSEPEIIERPNGLKYSIVDRGTGKFPMNEETVVVQYIGMLPDGTIFDSSFRRFESFSYKVGGGTGIPGWEEGIRLIKENGKAIIIMSPVLAYGKDGYPPAVPPNTDVLFYFEIKEIKPLQIQK